MMNTLSFDLSTVTGDPANASVTLSALEEGKIEFFVAVSEGTVADLRGLFFNISDQSLVNGLSVSGIDVTDSQFAINSVSNLGGGVNMNGTQTDFDGGVEIGTSGLGQDDIQSTTFILSHDLVDLTLDLFENQNFGIRLTSVGENRTGSSKLVGLSNLAPEAIPDLVNTEEDTAVTIAVLDNDDPGDQPVIISIQPDSSPSNGTVILNPDGTMEYTPNPDFFGEDAYTYRITDANGDISTATVTILVDPNPDAVDDDISIDEDQAITINILANDDIAGEPTTTVTNVSNPSNGTVILNPDNTLTYIPTANFFGVDNLTYTITDDDGDSSTATVNITINQVNDLPDAVDDVIITSEDTSINGNVLDGSNGGLDTDPDGDLLTVTANTNPSNGAVTVNPDGSYTYIPNENFNGDDSFQYTIDDGNGGTDTATVTISVEAVNDLPDAVENNYTVEANDDQEDNNTVEGNLITDETGEGVDNDPENDSLTLIDHTNPSQGLVNIEANGNFTYTPNNNFSGLDSFDYTIQDSDGATDTAVVTVNVIDPGSQTNTTQQPVGNPSQDVILELTTEEQTANDSTFVAARITIPELQQPNFNIVYIIDISGSTTGFFQGSPVGDQNNDGQSNTVLDAEIAGYQELTQSILDAGFGNDEVDIGVVTFSSNANLLGAFEPSDGDGLNDGLVNALEGLSSGGRTNFAAGLQQAINFLNAQPDVNTANNLVYFLSDGFQNEGGDYTDEAAILQDPNGIDAQVTAIGVGTGSSLSQLQPIDNTSGAEQVTSTDELTASLLGNPITGAQLTEFNLWVDGVNVNDDANFAIAGDQPVTNFINVDDLNSTPLGFELSPISLSGINPTVNHTITAQAIFDDGSILAVDNVITGALPTI